MFSSTEVPFFVSCYSIFFRHQLSNVFTLCALCLCVSSAGVGRTGTFIVIDAMIDMMHAEQKIDVFGFVSRIREQRSQLIQTDVSQGFDCFLLEAQIISFIVPNKSSLQMQYSFVYQALLEYYLYGDTELDVSTLEGHLHKLHNTFADGDRVGLEEEFKVGIWSPHCD